MKRLVLTCLLAGLVILIISLPQPQPVTSQEAPFDWRSDWALEKGFALDIDTEGYHFPTSIAFVPNPGPGPKDPLYFVTELRGQVKVVTNDRTIYTFAKDFAPKFTPKEELPSSYGEGGLAGLCLDAEHGYVFVTYTYQDQHQILRNNITRFQSKPETFSLEPESQLDFTEVFLPYESGLAHQIGPCQVKDESLYVSVGEAWQPRKTQDLNFMQGKILHMTLDGKPMPHNPFYQDNDIKKAINFVWASGLRNPFGLKVIGDRIFVADNGPSIDRFLEIHRGENYLYDGSNAGVAANAAYVLVPSYGPVQLDYYSEGLAIFPPKFQQRFYVALSGSFERGKMPGIMTLEYGLAENKMLSIPQRFLDYRGSTHQMVTGLAFGPDGLYVAPLFPNREGRSFVLKISYDPEHASAFTLTQNNNPQSLLREKGCLGCHTLNGTGGYGGAAGPDLSRDALVERLQARFDTEAYAESLKQIDSLDTEPQRSYKKAREEVLAVQGLDRVRTWMIYHINEPRFDNVFSQMPNLGVSKEEAQIIVDYLLAKDDKTKSSYFGLTLPRRLGYRHLLFAFIMGMLFMLLVLALPKFINSLRSHRKGETLVGQSR